MYEDQCVNRRRFTLNYLGLPDETVFVGIVERRRFICHGCKGRKVTVSVDWPKRK